MIENTYFKFYLSQIPHKTEDETERAWKLWDRYSPLLPKDYAAEACVHHIQRNVNFHPSNFVNLNYPELTLDHEKYTRPFWIPYGEYLIQFLEDTPEYRPFTQMMQKAIDLDMIYLTPGILGNSRAHRAAFSKAQRAWVESLKPLESAFIPSRWKLPSEEHFLGFLITKEEGGTYTITVIDPFSDLGEVIGLRGRKSEKIDDKTYVNPFLSFKNVEADDILDTVFYDMIYDCFFATEPQTLKEILGSFLMRLGLKGETPISLDVKYQRKEIPNCGSKLMNTLLKGYLNGYYTASNKDASKRVMRQIKVKSQELFAISCKEEFKDVPLMAQLLEKVDKKKNALRTCLKSF